MLAADTDKWGKRILKFLQRLAFSVLKNVSKRQKGTVQVRI